MWAETNTINSSMSCCGLFVLKSFHNPSHPNFIAFKKQFLKAVEKYNKTDIIAWEKGDVESLDCLFSNNGVDKPHNLNTFKNQKGFLSYSYMCLLNESQLFLSHGTGKTWAEELFELGFEVVSVRENPRYPTGTANNLYVLMFSLAKEKYNNVDNTVFNPERSRKKEVVSTTPPLCNDPLPVFKRTAKDYYQYYKTMPKLTLECFPTLLK